MAWWMWLTASAVLMLAEVLTQSFFLACFGLGALAAALVSGLGGQGAAQLGAFSLGALAALVFIRPLLTRRKGASPTNIDAYLGREAVALTALVPGNTPGTVRVGGEIWSARPTGGRTLPEGALLRIEAREGLVLLVGPARPEDANNPHEEGSPHD